jgi:hypothetical protein
LLNQDVALGDPHPVSPRIGSLRAPILTPKSGL